MTRTKAVLAILFGLVAIVAAIVLLPRKKFSPDDILTLPSMRQAKVVETNYGSAGGWRQFTVPGNSESVQRRLTNDLRSRYGKVEFFEHMPFLNMTVYPQPDLRLILCAYGSDEHSCKVSLRWKYAEVGWSFPFFRSYTW